MENVIRAAGAVLRTTAPRWRVLCEGVPASLLALPTTEGDWSALQCLHHLVDIERDVMPVRLKGLMTGKDFPAFDPDTQGTAVSEAGDPLDLVEQFVRLRAETLALLDRLAKDDLSRMARHEELGLVTMDELIHEWAAHDLMHTVQAERALMQPFIEGCGPWQPNFAEYYLGRG